MKNNKTRHLIRNIFLSALTLVAVFTGSALPAFAADGSADTSTTATDTPFNISKSYILDMPSGSNVTYFKSPAETFTFKSGAYPADGATDTGTDGEASLAAISQTSWNTVATDIQELSDPSLADVKTNVEQNTPAAILVGNTAFTEGAASAAGTSGSIAVTFSSAFKKPGIYFYDFHEAAGTTAGVEYNSNTYRIGVTVKNADGKCTPSAIQLYNKTSGSKTDNITNHYKAGELTFTKEVAGTMGDPNKNFTVTVKMKAPEGRTVKSTMYASGTDAVNETELGEFTWSPESKTLTKTYTVKDGTTITLKNIPAGTECLVEENDYSGDGYETIYKIGETTYTKVSDNLYQRVNNGSINVTITNTKNTIIDMGIFTSNLPYILILMAAVAGAVVFAVSRRKRHV